MLMPEELHDLVWVDVTAKISNLSYHKVILSLPEVLSGDFYNNYVKSGKGGRILVATLKKKHKQEFRHF